jgi:preprotein translocase subunit SecD
MNRYPLWKYLTIGLVLVLSILYALPNLYGEAPAVQVSSLRSSSKVDAALLGRVEKALQDAGVKPDSIVLEGTSIKARLADTDTQLKAKDALQKVLVPDAADASYIVALNLVPRTPKWLAALHASPMYLGLDLRGGVHFMLQVDLKDVIAKKAESTSNDLRTMMRDKDIRHSGISRDRNNVEVKFRELAVLNKAKDIAEEQLKDYQINVTPDGSEFKLTLVPKPNAIIKLQDLALKQNITTLHNRINELGVSEPVIAQQGSDRIVVQLPGVQDTAKAKDILGRTATLEMRLVDETQEGQLAEAGQAPVPFGSERFFEKNGRPVIVKKQVIATGENLTDAQTGIDQQSQRPKVDLSMDAKGGRAMRDVSRENIGKRMAIMLFEKGKGEAISVATIQGELGTRFQITGAGSTADANDLALLLRAGALAAPMEIIEERTIGPSLGAENIEKGFNSVTWGFVVIMAFMSIYYLVFGLFSSIALAVNLLLLLALLSLLQATLTLPGVAAMALALGMAIDSNVLINERVREELRAGASPQAAIHTGYDRAWATILDSNVTTLIAGLALLVFGSGPVRGFAVVHCLGILTSMFSAVLFSRGLVNLWYGRRKKLQTVSIGTVWKPDSKK